MDSITQRRFVTRIVIILVILNVVSAGILWYVHFQKGRQVTMVRQGEANDALLPFLRTELGLTDGQAAAFGEIRRKYADSGRALQRDMHRLKMELLEESMKDSPDSERIRQMTSMSGEKQRELDLILYTQFHEMYTLCDSGQKQRLSRLTQELLEVNRPPRNPGRP